LKNNLENSKRVLDVGSGSGYFTCLMSKMMNGGFVYGVDHIKELTQLSVKNIEKNHKNLLNDGNLIIRTSDGRLGLPEHAPYDCIHVGAAVDELPRKLIS